MTRIAFLLVAVVTAAGVVAFMAPASGRADGEAVPIFVTRIPAGYRDWRLISVAHEEGELNDIRAILGMTLRSSPIAKRSFRSRKAAPLPE
jgi:hypothetical protein